MTSAAYVHGQYRCYRLVNGTYRLYLDCTHTTPRAAIRHSTNLDPFVSPLKREAHAESGSPSGAPVGRASRLSRESSSRATRTARG